MQTTENLQNVGDLDRGGLDIGIGGVAVQMGLPRALARRSTPPPRQPEQQEGSDLYSSVAFLAEGGPLRVTISWDRRQ